MVVLNYLIKKSHQFGPEVAAKTNPYHKEYHRLMQGEPQVNKLMAQAQIDDAEMFAEDLLIFVMNQTVSSRRPVSRNLRPCCSSSPLTTSIKFVVRRYLEQEDEPIMNIFNSLLDQGDLNFHFRRFASTMALLVSVRGYSELEFVMFAAIICKLAVLGYANNFKTCLSYSVTAVVDAVRFFKAAGVFSSEESWGKMNSAVLCTIQNACSY